MCIRAIVSYALALHQRFLHYSFVQYALLHRIGHFAQFEYSRAAVGGGPPGAEGCGGVSAKPAGGNCDLGTGWMTLPVVCSNRQGGGERSIRLRACVAKAIPQTITERFASCLGEPQTAQPPHGSISWQTEPRTARSPATVSNRGEPWRRRWRTTVQTMVVRVLICIFHASECHKRILVLIISSL